MATALLRLSLPYPLRSEHAALPSHLSLVDLGLLLIIKVLGALHVGCHVKAGSSLALQHEATPHHRRDAK